MVMFGGHISHINLDPRTKYVLVLYLSSIAILSTDFFILGGLLCIGLWIFYLLGGDFRVYKRSFKPLLLGVMGYALLQCIFSYHPMAGLYKTGIFVLRMSLLVISGLVLSTSSERQLIQGLIQLKLPYRLAYMVLIGLRFLPQVKDEFKEGLESIQLQGINIDKLKLSKRINIYKYLITPVIIRSFNRAKLLAISMETRGFGRYPNRTSAVPLTFTKADKLSMVLCILVGVLTITWELHN